MKKTILPLLFILLFSNINFTLFAQSASEINVQKYLTEEHLNVEVKEYFVKQIQNTNQVKAANNHEFVHFFLDRFNQKYKAIIKSKIINLTTIKKSQGEIVAQNIITDIAEDFKQYKIENPNAPKNYNNNINVQSIDFIKNLPPENKVNDIRSAGQPCNNADFETGDATGWDLTDGDVNNTAYAYINRVPTGLNAFHTIVTGGNDPVVGAPLPRVNPAGGTSSLEIGDGTGTGARGAAASQTFLVDANSASFTYSYALILEDPSGHTLGEKPFFKVNMTDQAGNSIPCGEYQVIAGPVSSGGDPDFVAYSGGFYLPWRTTFAPLQAYIGQNVTIEFIIGDCSQGGHYGYGYIDASCQPLTIIPSQTVVCGGQAVTLNAPAGATSYNWSNGATTQNISTNIPGHYEVILTPVTGSSCAITLTADIGGSLDYPIAEFTPNPTNTCTGNPITFTNSSHVVGTSAIDSVKWDFTSDGIIDDTNFNTTFTYTTPGTFAVTLVAFNNGCSDDTIININVSQAPIATYTSVNESCLGACDGSITLSSANNSSFTFQWSSGQSTSNLTNLCGGSYTVTITDLTCGITTTNTQIINPGASVTVSTICSDVTGLGTNDGSSSATTTGGGGTYTFAWSPAPATGQTGAIATNLPGGTYTVTATDVASGCFATASCAINEPGCLVTPSTTVTDILCSGSNKGQISAEMHGSTVNSFTYQWDAAAANQTTQTAVGLAAGTYSVTINDSFGCQLVTNAIINEPTPLTIALTKINPLCNGGTDGSATVVASGGSTPYAYLWNDNLNQTSTTAFGIGADTLTAIVTDANNCTITNTIKILEPIAISTSSTTTSSNCGQADGGACVNASGGTGSFTFLWNNSVSLSCISNVLAGNYNVSVTDANNCLAIESIIISDLAGITAEIIDSLNVTCFGGSDGKATVNMIGGTGSNPTYNWTNNNSTPIANTPSIFNLTAGTYSVQITDSVGCKASTQVTIVEPTELVATPSFSNPICFNDCNGSAQYIASGGSTPYNYTWNDPAAQTSGTASNLCVGNYAVVVVDSHGCTISHNFTLVQPPLLNASIASTNIDCFGANNGTATISMISGVTPYSYNWTNSSQTSSSLTNLGPNVYSITISDPASCTITRSVTITEPTQLSVSVTSFANISCNGVCDGNIQVNANGGTTPYTYSWNNNSINQNLNAICPSTYQLTVTDANNCSSVLTQLITEPTLLNTTITGENIKCFGACDGKATLAANGGTQPYNYQWGPNANFQTSPIATNICAGNINITITDANGCSANESILLTQTADLNFSADTLSSNCGQSNGRISAGVNGGTQPYNFQWSDPNLSTTPYLLNIPAGCYPVVVTDANGCTINDVICINDIEGPKLTLFNSTDVSCFGACDGQINVNVSSPIAIPPTIKWEKSCLGTISPLPFFDDALAAFQLCACDYITTATDTAGCIASLAQTIVEPKELISLIPNSTNVTCFGGNDGQASVFTGFGTPPYSILWIPAFQTTTTATGLQTGTYGAVSTDAHGCKDTTSIVIIEPPLLKITGVTTNLSCNALCDGSISITTTGGKPPYNYFWNATLPNNATVVNLCANPYNLTVIDANSCTTSLSKTITEPLPLNATIAMTQSYCTFANGSATVANSTGGTPPYTYTWNTQPVQHSNTAIDLLFGNYTVNMIDQNGCEFPMTITVTDQPGPNITSITTTDPACANSPSGTACVAFTGGTSPVLFSWNDITLQNSACATGLLAGNYAVIVTDSNGCTDAGITFINQPNPLIAIPIGSTNICYGKSTFIWAAGQGGSPFTTGTSYSVTWADSIQWNGNLGPHLVAPITTTEFNYQIVDSHGCTASAGITVVVGPPLVISVPTEETICLGSSASMSATGIGGTQISDYCFQWDLDSIIDCGQATDTRSTSPVDTTTYRVILRDGCSAPDTAFIIVNVLPLPVPVFVPVKNEGCPPFETQFLGNSNMDTVNFCWDFNADGINDTCEIINTAGVSSSQNWVYENTGVYDVMLNVISKDGCESTAILTNAINVLPGPTANFTLAPTTIKLTNPTIFVNGTETLDADTLTWDFGDGNGATGILAQNSYNDTGKYNIILTAINEYGCIDTTLKTAEVIPDHALYTPNAFTPNGDGLNDFFYPDGIGISEQKYLFTVYNRWGEKVFESNTRLVRWDGSVNGSSHKAKIDVYIWKLTATDLNGNAIEDTKRVGQVSLVK